MELTFLHRDQSCVVINKPTGFIVHRGLTHDADDVMRAVRNRIRAHVYPVHGLDRGTSGALVFALSSGAARVLGKPSRRGASTSATGRSREAGRMTVRSTTQSKRRRAVRGCRQ